MSRSCSASCSCLSAACSCSGCGFAVAAGPRGDPATAPIDARAASTSARSRITDDVTRRDACAVLAAARPQRSSVLGVPRRHAPASRGTPRRPPEHGLEEPNGTRRCSPTTTSGSIRPRGTGPRSTAVAGQVLERRRRRHASAHPPGEAGRHHRLHRELEAHADPRSPPRDAHRRRRVGALLAGDDLPGSRLLQAAAAGRAASPPTSSIFARTSSPIGRRFGGSRSHS